MEAGPEDLPGHEYLRYAAGTYYVTSLAAVKLASMARHSLYGKVSAGVLQYWCATDKWVDRRREFFDSIRVKIEAQLGSKLVQARVEQLTQFDSIFQKAYQMLDEELVEADKWEAVAAVMVKIAALSDQFREKISTTLIPVLPGDSEGAPEVVRPQLTSAEAREAAKAIMRKRREQLRFEMAEKKRLESGDDSPPRLQMIPGGESSRG